MARMWFCSYLAYRFQYVTVRTGISSTVQMWYGVPQGSVLGLFAYILPILPSRLSPTVFMCICMLTTLKYMASVHRHQLLSCSCACRPVLMMLPIGCHQISYSSTLPRQRSSGVHQLGDRISCLPHFSECSTITWRHPQSSEIWVFILILMSACDPKSHELSLTASVLTTLRQLRIIRRSLFTQFSSPSLLLCCWRSSILGTL